MLNKKQEKPVKNIIEEFPKNSEFSKNIELFKEKNVSKNKKFPFSNYKYPSTPPKKRSRRLFKYKNKNRKKPKFKKKKKKRLKYPTAIVHINATYNNTLITIVNFKGQVIYWSSGGACGFKGARKSTSFAAKTAAEMAGKKALDKNIKVVVVWVKGTGPGRQAAIRGLSDIGLMLNVVRDITGIPHNGCRPPKKRRV